MTDIRQLLLDDGMAIDQRKTAGRVRNFFEHDFERYLGYAGLNPVDLSVIDDSHLSSPKMDASGVSAHGGINHQEDSTLRIIEAEKACHAVGKAIDNCRDSARIPYRTILREHYLRGLDDQKVMVLLGYEHSWYDSLKRRAECEFADRWDKWKHQYGVDYLRDLHVYLTDKNKNGFEAD